MAPDAQSPPQSRREWIEEVIFGYDTPAGKRFDVALLIVIVVSVIAVTLESVESIRSEYRLALRVLEWVVTGLFTIEYGVRCWAARKPLVYVFSFFGLVDLMSLLPTFIGFFLGGAHSLVVIRALRLLRIFRVLKLARFLGEERHLLQAVRASLPKMVVFLGAVLTAVVIVGAAMHLIEGPENGFTSIPRSMYWAIVTVTTVGYGDIAPQTGLGRALAAALMILGYGFIAVPTGVFSAELAMRSRARSREQGPKS